MHRPMRLFVALVPPLEVAAAMSTAVASSPIVLPKHRVIPPADLHLTLAFIGDTSHKDLRHVKESVERSCSGVPAFTLTPSRLVTIPTPADGGPPRLIAVATDSPPSLLEIQRRLATRLTQPKRNGHRSRFLPHVTIARYAHGSSSGAVDHALDLPPWPVSEVILVQSTLTAAGAIYTPVHTETLG